MTIKRVFVFYCYNRICDTFLRGISTQSGLSDESCIELLLILIDGYDEVNKIEMLSPEEL